MTHGTPVSFAKYSEMRMHAFPWLIQKFLVSSSGLDVGIAMGAMGSDAAIESADVAFTGHDLGLIPQALRHARRGGRIINQNIVLSLAIITVLLPLAITGVLGLAAVVLVHEVAEVVVIANGLRAARARKQ